MSSPLVVQLRMLLRLLLHTAAALSVQLPPRVPPRVPPRLLHTAAALSVQLPLRHRCLARAPAPRLASKELPVLVLLTGFEQFNQGLYSRSVEGVRDELDVRLFTERDIGEAPLEEALASADVFFASLLFDYDQVAWLNPRLERVPTRFVFESALELMSATRVGSFAMAGGGGGGPPAPVKALLSKFGSGKEEDRLAGYLNFLKLGPSLLKFVPGEKAADVRLWLEVYSYWNQGGAQNVETMLRLIAQRRQLGPAAQRPSAAPLPPPIETPTIGLVHPAAPGRYFATLQEYLAWFEARRELPRDAPRVGLLLYRKHVVSGLPYIGELVRGLEAAGLAPVPVFINGVEAHTVVRDAFLSRAKPRALGGASPLGCARVDAVVNTIGFPLVG